MKQLEPVKWQLIDPDEAGGLDLRATPTVTGPMNQWGRTCPWPWEFQQVEFDPKNPQKLHRCSHCNQVGTAGMEHPDFRELLTELAG